MGWVDDLKERWRALDRRLAQDMLRSFEARSGRVDMPQGGARSLDLAGVRALLEPGALPIIEHHWATWCDACLEDLPRIEELHVRLAGRARVVGVSWERFADARLAAEVVGHVEQFQHAHGLTFVNAIFDGGHDALIRGLSLPVDTIPITRVVDRDGGVLRVFHGPLDDADVRQLLELLG
jgi:hypothetical protein